MTVTNLGQMTVGAALPATASAVAAIDVLVAGTLPEVVAKLTGYGLLAIPGPEFDIGVQIGVAGEAFVAAMAELDAIPGGIALAAALTTAVAAQAAAQLAIRGAAPTIAIKLDAALAAKAGLEVQASVGVSGPNVNLTLIGQIVAELEGLKAMIEAQASLAAEISTAMAAAGLAVYRFDGATVDLGTELGAAVATLGITGETHAILLVATTAGAWSGVSATVAT